MTTLTKRCVLEAKYTELQEKVNHIVDLDIFPSLEELNLTDTIILIQMYFDDKSDNGIYQSIISLSKLQSIHLEEDEILKLIPVVKEFLNFLEFIY